MQTRFHVQTVALSAAVVLGGWLQVASAEPSGRKVVIARQEVRASLASAMADGVLSRHEHGYILWRAKQLLGTGEFEGLQRTLDRLAEPSRAPMPPQYGKFNIGQSTPSERAAAEMPDNRRQTELVAYRQPANAESDANIAPMPPGSPFLEEDYEDDIDTLYDECCDVPCDQPCGYEDYCGCGGVFATCSEGWRHIRFSTTVEAFRGPLDLDSQNGNFGFAFAVNGGFPLAEARGIGLQVGTSAVLSDLQGTQFTGSTIRSQNFTTVGLFQRIPTANGCKLKWGFAFDWLYDDYYTTLKMSQWRVKLAYELDCCREIGMWACIPDDGDDAVVDRGYYQFKPIPQGNFYYRRCWANGADTTTYVGIIEEPGECVFGARARIPFSGRISLIGNFNYVLPAASGAAGQDDEMWHVAIGLEFVPGYGGNRCQDHRFTPLMPLADNGIFAIRQR